MNIHDGSEHISRTLLQDKPCLIGRNGTIEIQVLSTGAHQLALRQKLELHAGVFPSTEESVEAWIRAYKAALNAIDEEPLVAGWYAPMKLAEERLLKQSCLSDLYIPLRSLEPYYVEPHLRWTHRLEGKKVAVVSSFAKTIREQLRHRDSIWVDEVDSLLPATTEWIPIQTGYSPALAQGRATWPVSVKNWQDAIHYMKEQVMRSGAKICLIGCGGLGMILGAELKRAGLQCLVLGGATQVLFGIKGRRWETHEVISKFWNEAWVWPSRDETPGGAASIEGGCYWSDISG